jgi:phosphohistidine phosphatase
MDSQEPQGRCNPKPTKIKNRGKAKQVNTHWILVRHAKSDWEDANLDDKQRPLSPRGKKAAVLLGEKIQQLGMTPDRILCSGALRATQTLQGILQVLSQYSLVPVPEILYFENLYLANPETITKVVASNHGGKQKLMCIGHNPGMEILASQLAKQTLQMKTAHMIVLRKNTPWGNASQIGEGWEIQENIRGEEG